MLTLLLISCFRVYVFGYLIAHLHRFILGNNRLSILSLNGIRCGVWLLGYEYKFNHRSMGGEDGHSGGMWGW